MHAVTVSLLTWPGGVLIRKPITCWFTAYLAWRCADAQAHAWTHPCRLRGPTVCVTAAQAARRMCGGVLPTVQHLIVLGCLLAAVQHAAAQKAAPQQQMAVIHDPFFFRDSGGPDKNLAAIRKLLPLPLKIHIYDMPWFNLTTCTKSFGCQLLNRVKRSKYYTPNPEEADFWWIPSAGELVGAMH